MPTQRKKLTVAQKKRKARKRAAKQMPTKTTTTKKQVKKTEEQEYTDPGDVQWAGYLKHLDPYMRKIEEINTFSERDTKLTREWVSDEYGALSVYINIGNEKHWMCTATPSNAQKTLGVVLSEWGLNHPEPEYIEPPRSVAPEYRIRSRANPFSGRIVTSGTARGVNDGTWYQTERTITFNGTWATARDYIANNADALTQEEIEAALKALDDAERAGTVINPADDITIQFPQDIQVAPPQMPVYYDNPDVDEDDDEEDPYYDED